MGRQLLKLIETYNIYSNYESEKGERDDFMRNGHYGSFGPKIVVIGGGTGLSVSRY